jgi:hypothetical protein
VYHWRCLLISQKEVMIATRVKKPDMIHPTSCATDNQNPGRETAINDDNGDDKKHISQTLEDDIAVLKEGRSLLGCLGRETSGIFRHNRLTASRCDKKNENSINEEIVK